MSGYEIAGRIAMWTIAVPGLILAGLWLYLQVLDQTLKSLDFTRAVVGWITENRKTTRGWWTVRLHRFLKGERRCKGCGGYAGNLIGGECHDCRNDTEHIERAMAELRELREWKQQQEAPHD